VDSELLRTGDKCTFEVATQKIRASSSRKGCGATKIMVLEATSIDSKSLLVSILTLALKCVGESKLQPQTVTPSYLHTKLFNHQQRPPDHHRSVS
jgi:hypothetical protein